jgi:hypothetical protein
MFTELFITHISASPKRLISSPGFEKLRLTSFPGCDFSLEQGEKIILPGFFLKVIGKWIPPVINASLSLSIEARSPTVFYTDKLWIP